MGVTASDIAAAAARIAPHVLRPPLVRATRLSEELGLDLRLKPETLQETGTFKIRGATNAVMRLSPEERARGVITVSSGNHGPALAAAATKLGVRCTVCLSTMVPENKVENVRLFGGHPHIAGAEFDEAAREAARLAAETGAVMVPPFDHPDVLAGAGTVGREIIEDWPAVDAVIAPLSGGGLLGGVAIAVKAAKPDARVIGVSMARGAVMHASLAAGRPIELPEEESLADALGGGIGLDNRWTFAPVRDLVDQTLLVPEPLIAEAMRRLFRDQGLVAEGAGAVGVSALLQDRLRGGGLVAPGAKVAVVVSGRNIGEDALMRVLDGAV